MTKHFLLELSKFFSNLSYLRCYRSAFQALQINIEMQGAVDKRSKENMFFHVPEGVFLFSLLPPLGPSLSCALAGDRSLAD
jgi:hypothetical protein